MQRFGIIKKARRQEQITRDNGIREVYTQNKECNNLENVHVNVFKENVLIFLIDMANVFKKAKWEHVYLTM